MIDPTQAAGRLESSIGGLLLGTPFRNLSMAMTIETFRKLVALDPDDPLSRFALGKKLAEPGATEAELREAAGHLRFANERSPSHLATYHILAGVLIALGENEEAGRVLTVGVERVAQVGEGMGRDLGPAMRAMLASLG